MPSVGLRAPELWARVGAMDPAALAAQSPGPYLVELGGGEAMADVDSVTLSSGRREDVGRKPWDTTRVLCVCRRRHGETGRITVGRAATNDVVIPAAMMSKEHAFFLERDGRYGLADAGSRNGTRIDGESLAPGTAYAVAPGAELVFGESVFLFVAPAALLDTLRGLFPDETAA